MTRAITAGFFNPVHPDTVMVLGDAGAHYLSTLKPAARRALPRALRRRGLRVLVAAPGQKLDPAWARAGIEIRESRVAAHETVLRLRELLREAAVESRTVHGTLLSVHGIGVLLSGKPGAGKSALALELVARGHRLVADDVVEIRREAAGVLTGHCPPLLKGYLETRGLGLVDIRKLHGEAAAAPRARLELIVELGAGGKPRAADRLKGRRGRRRILGEAVAVLSLPPELVHNRAALVEAAALAQRLRDEGEDAAATFEQRQARAIGRRST